MRPRLLDSQQHRARLLRIQQTPPSTIEASH